MEDDEPDDRPVLRMQNAPMLVRDVFVAKGFRIIDDEDYEDDDPELKGWHVMWKGGRFKPSEYAAANPLQRLGSGKRGDADVLQHGYLRAHELRELHQRAIKAPWMPKLAGPKDASHFEATQEVEEEELAPEYAASKAYVSANLRLDEAFSSL